jgi:3-oxoacyl-[acyl-carrier protein] reductase
MNMELGLNGKVALVTGGSKGIGLRIARGLVAEGCDIGICGRTAADLQATADELARPGAKSAAAGRRVVAVQADVTKPEEAGAFVARCAAELGRVDILVNNVGGSFGGFLMEATDADWRATFEINLFQVIRMIRLVVPHMRQAGGGSVINISSISGWEPQLSGEAQYGASKAALIFLTERLALELSRERIRVNTVSPGSIIWEGGGWDPIRLSQPQEFAAYVRDGFPFGRLGKPEEIADVVVFLASERASWVNGRNIPVDGLEQPVAFANYRGW